MCSNLSYFTASRVPPLTHLNLCLPILFDLNKTCHSSSYASSLSIRLESPFDISEQPIWLSAALINRLVICTWICVSALQNTSKNTTSTMTCHRDLDDSTTKIPHIIRESDIYWGIKITWINVLQYYWSNEAQNTNQASIYSHLLLDKTFSCKTTAQHALLGQNRFQPNAHYLMHDFPSPLHEFSFL